MITRDIYNRTETMFGACSEKNHIRERKKSNNSYYGVMITLIWDGSDIVDYVFVKYSNSVHHVHSLSNIDENY